MTLGEQISRRRKDLGISQEELGDRLGVSRQAVSKWETGKTVPDMENLMALANLFGVPLSELTGTPPEKSGSTSSETEARPENEKSLKMEEAPPVQAGKRSLRFWVLLGLAGLAGLLLIFGIPFLLLCRNSVHVSDQPVEFSVPVEEAGPPERLPQEPDGEPNPPESLDTSALSEPNGESKFLSDAEKVYRAFNQLASDSNLTAEERYAFRRDLFACLPSMDWTEFGRLGTVEEESDCIFALMNFILALEDYSAAEIYRLQRTAANPGIDGAYAEFYAGVLSQALYRYPIAFVRGLAYDDSSELPWSYYALSLASFDLSYFPEMSREVVNTLETALSDGSFNENETGWCRLLLLYLEETEDGDQSGLPRSPEELGD